MLENLKNIDPVWIVVGYLVCGIVLTCLLTWALILFMERWEKKQMQKIVDKWKTHS